MPASPLQLGILLAAAFCAGVVDAIGGGGGLITVPVLLWAGLPPHQVLGTNKGQSVFGTTAALVRYGRAGLIAADRAPISFAAGLLGAFAGASLVLRVRPEVLRPLVLALLVGAAGFLALRRPAGAGQPVQPGAAAAPPRNRARDALLAAAISLCLGAYDGFFGPGTGTFLIVAFTLAFHAPLARASADAKVVNFASNLAALATFAVRGTVLWRIALPMAAAQFAGGALGAHLAVRGGDARVRWVVLCVVAALVLKLGWDSAAGLLRLG